MTEKHDTSSGWMTDKEVASYLGVSAAYLKKLRLAAEGPRFARFGRSIRYNMKDVDSWAESCLRKQASRRAS
jgi:excisionase family DNA binding protein